MWLLREETSTHLYFHSPITAIDHHVTQTVAIIGTQSGTVNVVNTASPDNVLKKISLLPPPGVKSTTITAAGTAAMEEGRQEEEEDEDVGNCVESLAMAPSHPWFAVGRNDGTMCIYEMDSNSPRSIFQSNQMMVSYIIFCVQYFKINGSFLAAQNDRVQSEYTEYKCKKNYKIFLDYYD